MKKYFGLLIISGLFLSCAKEESRKEKQPIKQETVQSKTTIQELSIEEKLKKYFEAINVEYKTNHIFYITEMQGCGFCINKSVEYAKESDQENITFIFSCDNKGVKNLNNKLGEAKEKESIIIEGKNLAYQYGITQAKPTAFFVSSDSIRKFEFVPDNFPEGIDLIESF